MAISNVASASSSAVQAAINSASPGDTVLLPGPGNTANGTVQSATWSAAQAVVITAAKPLTLNGNGCTITLSVSDTLDVTCGTTASIRITGFNFLPTGTTSHGAVLITGTTSSAPYRFDNNTMSEAGGIILMDLQGNGPGLIDHCSFTGGGAAELIHNLGMGNGNSSGWQDNIFPGSSNMVYLESNTFKGTDSTFLTSAIETYNGGRNCLRANTFIFCQIDQHGDSTNPGTLTSPANVGTRWFELYNNTWTLTGSNGATAQSNYFALRGGSGVVFNNKTSGAVHNGGAGSIEISEDSTSGTYPIPWQPGRGIQQSGALGSSPVYVWNNVDTAGIGGMGAPGSDAPFVLSGRDFMVVNSTTIPNPLTRCQQVGDNPNGTTTYNYAPFVFPYPLTAAGLPNPSGGSTPPAGNPTFIQHLHSGMDRWPVGTIKFSLPNIVQTGNGVIIGVHFNSAGSISSVVDNSANTWIAGPTTTNTGSAKRLNTYYVPSCLAGTQTVTITFTGLTSVTGFPHIVASEFFNIGTLDVSGSSNNTPSVALTTTNPGDLIWHWAVDFSDTNSNGGNFNGTSITAGSGFTLLSADRQIGSVVQFQVQSAAGLITPTITRSGTATWGSVALAFSSAATGVLPGPGIRIIRIYHVLLNSFRAQGRGNPLPVQFPSSGNLIVGSFNSGGATVPLITAISDNLSNSWVISPSLQSIDSQNVVSSEMVYVANAATGQNLVITSTINVTNTGDGMFLLYDITGAATTPFDKGVITNGIQNTHANLAMGSPIVPAAAGELIINVGSIDFHTCRSGLSPMIFDSVVNNLDDDDPSDGGTDVGTIDMDNPYGHIYATNTASQSFTYSFSGPGATFPGVLNWSSVSAAFSPTAGSSFVNATVKLK